MKVSFIIVVVFLNNNNKNENNKKTIKIKCQRIRSNARAVPTMGVGGDGV